jgi:hypothetical protein
MHEAACGTLATCRLHLAMSAFRDNRKTLFELSSFDFGTKRTSRQAAPQACRHNSKAS